MTTERRADGAAVLVLLAVVAALFVALPRQGDIWWMDASRHALNGAFVLDFLRHLPLHHPTAFAYDYYRQWPALTVLFYPPLFYGVEAAVYAIAGVSEQSALLAENLFLFALGWGAFRLSRRWLGPAPALAVALLVIGAPEIAFWGRQVMLDVPAYAFIVWAAERHLDFLHRRRPRALYLAVILAIASVYTKYNAVFFLAVIGASLLEARAWRLVPWRVLVTAAALGAALLAPVVALFLVFGAYNLQQAAAVPGDQGARWGLQSWLYYAEILPSVVSWPTIVLAVMAPLALWRSPSPALPRRDAAFLLSWLLIGYVFYALIAVKEPRHIMAVIYPLALAAVLTIDRALAGWRLRGVAALTLGAGVLAGSVALRPAPYVAGMRAAAQQVAAVAPHDTNVAFWGRLDGTFIYAMRAVSGRPDLGVVRLDKLLFGDLAVAVERGFTDRGLTEAQWVDTLRELHVQYVVAQSGYLDQVAGVQTLMATLASAQFVPVATIGMASNYPYQYVTDLTIYRFVETVPTGRVSPAMQIKLLGRTL